MNTNLGRYWALSGLALLSPALIGCGDNSSVTTGATDTTTTGTTTDGTASSSTTGPSTGEPTDSGMSASETGTTTTTGTPTTTTTGPTTGTSTTDDTSSTTDPLDMCVTILCGEPVVCCAEGEECVDGACQAECPSGVRCGPDKSICCESGEVCLGDVCEAPLGPCEDSYDCDPGNYCEPVFDQCLPQPDPLDCEVVPNFGAIDVQTEWAWTEHEVISLPVIADVDGDGTPDVVVNTSKMVPNDTLWRAGEIVLLDGKTGTKKWQIPEDPGNNQFGSNGRASIAVGDVNGDGKPDIIYPGRINNAQQAFSRVHAVDGTDGSLIWTARNADNTDLQVRIDGASVTVTNFDDDPEAEIAIGALIIDHDGLVVWNQNNIGPRIGSPLMANNTPYYYGGLATVADLDGDNIPELITGRQAWKVNWVQGDPPSVTLVEFWNNNNNPNQQHNNDGWPSVADLDGDGKPEVIITAYPTIRVLNGQTGQLWCGVDPTDMLCQMNPMLRTQPIEIEGGNLGGPATIADFDGDGRPEAGIAGGTAYAVYDFFRPGFAGDGVPETIVKLPMAPDPIPGAMYPRWRVTTQDNSSAATGSSVFDFQGDGAAEAVYQDECFARVYDGATGQVQLQIMNSSATIHEYPLVADVDGDGNSEFIVVANFADPQNVTACTSKTPNFTPRKGVFVYGAGGDNWVPTRKVWTQHTYHVTNADSSGNPPLDEEDNWLTAGLNNFRQNVQGEGVFNAPDLTISLAADLNQCSDDLVLAATIYNEGTLGVAAGIDVTFYEGVDNTGIKLGTKPTTQDLLPGGSTQLTWTVPGPTKDAKKNFFVEIDPGINNGLIQECNEDNNGALITEAFCPEAG